MDGKGESEQSPLLWTPEELAPNSNISKSLREGAKVLLARRFCEISLTINQRWKSSTTHPHNPVIQREGLSRQMLGVFSFQNNPSVPLRGAGCAGTWTSKINTQDTVATRAAAHHGLHHLPCRKSCPSGQAQARARTPAAAPVWLHCPLNHPWLCPAAPCPAREGTAYEAEKPQEAKSLLAVKQGEGHLPWLLTFNMQK